MRRECKEAAAPPGTVFELFGMDFLVDASDHPWLLEVNATPSLAVEHTDPAGEMIGCWRRRV
jgi:D-alanine-D-alanine ligase-like ATP-grasp enzyme